MKILIACEYSGRVREAFRKKGHDVVSCDFEAAEDGSPHHYQGDVFDLLNNQQFDMMIAHPPCTYLCNSGVRWLYKDGRKKYGPGNVPNLDGIRYQSMLEARMFFLRLKRAGVPKIAIENPIMHLDARAAIGPATQFVQPWHFGEEAFKATGLWLTNLPALVATNKLTPPKPGTPEHKRWSAIHRAPPAPNRWKLRSRTFQGIANAMAEQWG